ncbi:MAG: sugar transferase [Bdellovibrionota bacterium]|jgi:exopolysaccharide biosynthesis polyprenyl glycosylphosphotransferase
MLKKSWKLISQLEKIGDFLIAIIAFFLAYYGRASFVFWNEVCEWGLPFAGESLAPISDYVLVILIALFTQTVVLNIMGAYSSMRLRSSLQVLWMFVVNSIAVFFTLAAASFLLKLDFSRSFIALFAILLLLMLAAERYVVLWLLRFFRRRGFNYRNVVICGTGKQALILTARITAKPELGLMIRSYADLSIDAEQRSKNIHRFKQELKLIPKTRTVRVVEGVADLEKVLSDCAIDEVIFTDTLYVMPQVRDVVQLCAEQGIRTTIAADLFSTGLVKSGLSYFEGIPLVHFVTPPGDMWELTLKRCLDIVVSALLLVLLMPFLILVGIIIKLTSPGPILYVQKRVGLNGHQFDLYKFRSMYVDADKRLPDLMAQNEMSGPAFKMKNDPRVTPVGKWLRRYSIDELPQLWNVLIGDMSLVGPRPPVPGEVRAYERRYRRRLSMRPGMTCTWQVSGRNDITDFSKWVQLDLEYIDNWSLTKDLSLLFRTIPAVLFGQGAH